MPRVKIEFACERVPQLGSTPYLGFAIKAHAELIAEGLADSHIQLVSWTNKAVVAKRLAGRQAGLITFFKNDTDNTFYICIGYVEPMYRGGGAYRLMWDELVAWAKSENVSRIVGVTKMGNARMRAVAASLGRVEESVNLSYTVS